MDTHTPPRNRSQKLGIGGLALLACIAVALCGLTFSPTAAHAAVGDYGTLEDGTYTVSPILSSSMYWDVVDGSTDARAKIQSYHHNGTVAQVWKITTDSDGYSTIVSVKSGLALDITGGTMVNGNQLQQYTPNGTEAQKWKIIECSNGYKIVSAKDESFVIDLCGASTADRTAIQIWSDASVPAQRWAFTKVADEKTTVVSDKGKLFDTSAHITDAQPGTITWETVPSGWEAATVTYGNRYITYSTEGVVYTGGKYYSGGDATPVARIDKCCKVNGKWASVRLTFSNISSTGIAYDSDNGGDFGAMETSISFHEDNIWSGIWAFSINTLDMNVELFYTDTGETISLEGSWFTGASLNARAYYDSSTALGESCKYLTDKDIESYTIEGTGLVQLSDGTWMGGEDLYEKYDWDTIGNEDFLIGSVAFALKDEKPTFRLGYGDGTHRGRAVFNLSPLTIATPEGPTKSVEITE